MQNQSDELSKRLKQLALRIIKLATNLPPTPVGKIIANQILRSGTSIGANYHEARRARSRAEFLSKIGDCLKEASETSYWLELIAESNTVKPTKLCSLITEINEVCALLFSIHRTTKTKKIINHKS
jgi:four helix bundle protein